MLRSSSLWALSGQYFASNFTFFFCLTWLFPQLKERFDLTGFQAGLYASVPLLFGALGNWVSGIWVDRIYREGAWVRSRRLPAIIGFACSAIGLVGSVWAETPLPTCLWFSLSIFGADMTLAPSWAACMDIGKKHSGVLSGTMNMAGNIGAFITALAFPSLLAWTGSAVPFFYLAASLNLLAIFAWLAVNPTRTLEVAS
jgi:ACS family glucarate transporter-like MFS transporter